jgi:hypothetical protein
VADRLAKTPNLSAASSAIYSTGVKLAKIQSFPSCEDEYSDARFAAIETINQLAGHGEL